MIAFLSESWPWYISGPLLGLIVPLLLWLGNKQFGISSTLKHICAACIPTRAKFFNYDWQEEKWNLFFSAGIIIGGGIAAYYFNGLQTPELSEKTNTMLASWGIMEVEGFAPDAFKSIASIQSLSAWFIVVFGGFLVGFGTRWANGCTSGHAIMGLSMLNPGSLVAVIGFFIGGLTFSHFLIPHLF